MSKISAICITLLHLGVFIGSFAAGEARPPSIEAGTYLAIGCEDVSVDVTLHPAERYPIGLEDAENNLLDWEEESHCQFIRLQSLSSFDRTTGQKKILLTIPSELALVFLESGHKAAAVSLSSILSGN